MSSLNQVISAPVGSVIGRHAWPSDLRVTISAHANGLRSLRHDVTEDGVSPLPATIQLFRGQTVEFHSVPLFDVMADDWDVFERAPEHGDLWSDDVPDALRSNGWTRVPTDFSEEQLSGVRPLNPVVVSDGRLQLVACHYPTIDASTSYV